MSFLEKNLYFLPSQSLVLIMTSPLSVKLNKMLNIKTKFDTSQILFKHFSKVRKNSQNEQAHAAGKDVTMRTC